MDINNNKEIWKDNDGNIIETEATAVTAGFKYTTGSASTVGYDAPGVSGLGETITLADILKRIDLIAGEDAAINEAMSALNFIDAKDVAYGSDNAGTKANAIRDAVKEREATKQKSLDFLKMVYEDMKPQTGTVASAPDYLKDLLKESVRTNNYETTRLLLAQLGNASQVSGHAGDNQFNVVSEQKVFLLVTNSRNQGKFDLDDYGLRHYFDEGWRITSVHPAIAGNGDFRYTLTVLLER
ncbi:MAG: hypothetical protein FWC95_01775 [Defluviitaleaceae bacterium]|nr:hypothetical protein [Defluviitaleaceae bacterium]